MIYPVILCGGHGSRLWPISRENRPKQFIGFATSKSLLQNTIKRIDGLPRMRNPYILTNQKQRYLVENQLLELGVSSAEIILESEMKSTSPAITLAAIEIFKENPNGIMLILSSDNDIKKAKEFRKVLASATDLSAEKNKFLLFGSKAYYPEPAYGYIKSGHVIGAKDDGTSICRIEKFIEKPSIMEAEACIKDGYQWNSGIFVLPVSLYLEEMGIYSPSILENCRQSIAYGNKFKSKDSPYSVTTVSAEAFGECQEISIDYALMEKTDNAAVVRTGIGWSDVGSWSGIYEIQNKDGDGNVIKAKSCISINNRDVQVYSQNKNKLIAAVNLEGITIVDSYDAVLVLDTKSSQDVKKVVNNLKLEGKFKFLTDPVTFHSWGKYEVVTKTGKFVVKKVTLNQKKTYISNGNSKRKQFMVVKGKVELVIKGQENQVHSTGSYFIVDPNKKYKIRCLLDDAPSKLLKLEF
jgi:mannose-1-phosphate guanylyltransferase/mannose-6-phosphate isomerase